MKKAKFIGGLPACLEETKVTNYESGSRAADKFVIRLPEGLRSEVEQESVEADRSMNAVFIQATKAYLNSRQQKKSLIDVLQRAVDAQTEFDIDAHAQMAKDATRYRWLRSRERVTDADIDLVAARDKDCFYGPALDREIDEGRGLAVVLEKHGEPT